MVQSVRVESLKIQDSCCGQQLGLKSYVVNYSCTNSIRRVVFFVSVLVMD